MPTGPYGAIEIVNDSYATFKDLGLDTFERTLDYIGELSTYPLPEVPAFEVEFPDLGEIGTPFEKPPAPAQPDTTYSLPSPPPQVNVQTPGQIDVSGQPTLSASEPVLTLPPTPDALLETPPSDAPTVSDVVIPEFVEPTLPSAPTLVALTIPEPPTLNLPTFNEVVPPLELDFNVADFSYTEQVYNSALLDTLRARITDMIDGGTGLPAEVETALFDRARSREDANNLKATQTAVEEWSSRGFTLPAGEISRRLSEARESSRMAVNTLQRDIMVQVHQAALEQLKAGVAAGAQLEASLMNYMSGYAERALRAAIAVVEMSVAVLNARIGLYNAQIARVGLLVQIYDTQVRAELTKIEVFKAQIDAERIRGEINEQNVRLYTAQVQAAVSLLDIYRARIEGVKAQVDVDRNRIEVYKTRVQAYGELVNAKKTEYEGYSAAVQGEVAKVGIYESTVRAFAERVRAYSSRIDASVAANRAQVDSESLKVAQYDARIRAYAAEVNAEVGRIQAVSSIYDGQTRAYAAELGAESARVQADSRQFELQLEQGRATTQLQLAKTTSQTELAIRASEQALDAMKATATILSQIAAGALSAINTGASLSGSDVTTYAR